MFTTDFLVIGGGVIGLSIAREMKRLYPDSRITLIEKESECGLHASGRNSGVLHAGFYYSPNSMKARFTRQGNEMFTEYCLSKNIPLNRCGKLVVAKDSSEHKYLDELLRRGKANGIELHDLTEEEATKIEPRVRTRGRALFSPTTSTVDPRKVMQAMTRDALDEGVSIKYGIRFVGRKQGSVLTSDGSFQAGYVINAAGLYADKIANEYGFSERYRILPFKGLYLYSDEPPGSIRTNIYPVPDLRNPFLGVHFTVTVDGKIKIGPTAIPAFWREHYNRFENFSLPEFIEIVKRELGLFLHSDFDFKRLTLEELKKYSRARMVSLSSQLAEGIDTKNYRKWGPPGIRAQLFDIKEKKLEMDFVVEGDERSMHVLNAVSPAFTCALTFSQHVSREIQSRLN
jgi:L-2-hydroxyglutarate oxidase